MLPGSKKGARGEIKGEEFLVGMNLFQERAAVLTVS